MPFLIQTDQATHVHTIMHAENMFGKNHSCDVVFFFLQEVMLMFVIIMITHLRL